MFGDFKYLFQLYQLLHSEDTAVEESALKAVSLENIFTDGIYNALGFIKCDKLLVHIEAQSTWTVNIIIRALEYLINSYRRYISENNIDLYKSKKAELPRPELYVIFTGSRKTQPEEITTLSEEFFGGSSDLRDFKLFPLYGTMQKTTEGLIKVRENRVKISDIAEELGLSTATVSYVLHGKERIPFVVYDGCDSYLQSG